jgi:hypothetical protein
MRVHLPPFASTDALAVSAGPLEPLPPAVDTDWLGKRLTRGAPGFRTELVEQRSTALGWPALVAFGRFGDLAVLRVYFRFLDHGALAEAYSPDPAQLERAWEILAEARPDWSGDLAAIGQLFLA